MPHLEQLVGGPLRAPSFTLDERLSSRGSGLGLEYACREEHAPSCARLSAARIKSALKGGG